MCMSTLLREDLGLYASLADIAPCKSGLQAPIPAWRDPAPAPGRRPADFSLTFRAGFWKIFALSHPPETPMLSLSTSRARRLLPLLLVIFMLLGCGQKGALRLPDEGAAPLAPAATPG